MKLNIVDKRKYPLQFFILIFNFQHDVFSQSITICKGIYLTVKDEISVNHKAMCHRVTGASDRTST